MIVATFQHYVIGILIPQPQVNQYRGQGIGQQLIEYIVSWYFINKKGYCDRQAPDFMRVVYSRHRKRANLPQLCTNKFFINRQNINLKECSTSRIKNKNPYLKYGFYKLFLYMITLQGIR